MATQSVFGLKNKKGQVITDPWKMMNEAETNRTPTFYTGSEVIK